MNLSLSQQTLSLPHNTEESVLWKSLLKGDRKALSDIYSRYFDKLYNYGSKISQDAGIVEDSIQDVFIELWNRREGLNHHVQSIKFYLYKCLRREIVRKLNRHHHNIEVADLESFELQLSHKSHYLNHQMDAELRKRLTDEIHLLSPKQKEVIFLIYFDELSYAEVAAIMSLKIKTIYNLVHQAIAKLKGRKNVFWQMFSFTL